jgi:diguanylate cyclase (GGDEF)-like protein
MPESGFNEARVAIQRLHGVLQGYMRKKGWPVTFSIGVATFVTPPHNVEEMIKKADHLMYTAKRNGKNVIMYGVY